MDDVIKGDLEKKNENVNPLLISPKGDAKSHHGMQRPHLTNYCETLTHLFRGNIGPGLFAMGYAIKSAGLIVGPIATIILGYICVHSQHILVNITHNLRAFSTF